MQSRVKIVLSLAVSASTSGSVSPGVDPYSLMYLYKYTGKGQIRTHLCTYTNIQVSGRSVLTYVPVLFLYKKKQVRGIAVLPYVPALTIIQVKGRSVLTYVPVNSCTIIQVRGGSVLTFVSVQFTMCVDFFKGTFFIQREQESSKNFVDIFFIIGFKCYYGFCHFHLNKF